MPLDFIADEARSFFPVVLEQLGIARFVLFGHSVGGGMAVHCAAASGERCEALITESAQAFVEDRTVQGLLAAREQFKEPGQLERLARHHGADDEYGSPRHPELIGRLAGGTARIELMVETGHVPHRERAEVVLATARDWLAALE